MARVVIQVHSGIVEAVENLSDPEVEVSIVDWDELVLLEADELQSKLEEFPQEVRAWVQKEWHPQEEK
jgi:NAD(P)H-dependent FMN reductase